MNIAKSILSFLYKDQRLETVKEFKFLGNYISENGNVMSSAKILSEKALKVNCIPFVHI